MSTNILPAVTSVPVIPFPSPAKPEITQEQLVRIIELRNSIAALKAELELAEGLTKAALEAGVSVEIGVHVASLKESYKRSVAWKDVSIRLAERLYGDGRGSAYAA